LPESPAVGLNISAECWCGAYQRRDDFEALLSVHPEIFEKLLDVENAQNGRYTFLFEKGQQVPLVQLTVAPRLTLGAPAAACGEQASGMHAKPHAVD
jgi:hypothetical protein